MLAVQHECCVVVKETEIKIIPIDKKKNFKTQVRQLERQGYEVYAYETYKSLENSAINFTRQKNHIEKLELFFDKE